MIKGNMIRDCPMTVEDVDMAERIWGPDVSYLKGRTVRRTLRAIVSRTMEIPRIKRELCQGDVPHGYTLHKWQWIPDDNRTSYVQQVVCTSEY